MEISREARWAGKRLAGWLAGGPLLRVATIRRTTDTFFFISYTTNVLLLKFLAISSLVLELLKKCWVW
jgi:hypothetical protein